MPPSLLCVDANLVFRGIAEPDNAAVQRVWQRWRRERRSLAAPRLLRYEVTNALHRAQQHGLLSRGTAVAALRAVLALPIRLHEDDGLHERALDLAGRFGLAAAYDAHYVALAEQLGVELWTADRRLARAVQEELSWVRLVEA